MLPAAAEQGDPRAAQHDPDVTDEHDETPERRTTRETMKLNLPPVDPRLAAVLTGAMVGLVGVILTLVAARGCEAVRGVGSCGGIGLFALLTVLGVEVVLGAMLLTAWKIPDAVSTSFLAIGLVAVFVLLFLLRSLDSIWMLVVIPLMTAASYVLSWRVTASLVDVDEDETVDLT